MKNPHWRHLEIGDRIRHNPSGQEYLVLEVEKDQEQAVTGFQAYRVTGEQKQPHPGVKSVSAELIQVTGNSEDWSYVKMTTRAKVVMEGAFVVRRAATGEIERQETASRRAT